jgi:hypothetical protein
VIGLFRRKFREQSRPRIQAWMALFVICILVTHSLHTCAAHLGKSLQASSRATIQLAATADASEHHSHFYLGSLTHITCQSLPQSHRDGCESTSEEATVKASTGIKLALSTVIDVPLVAVLPDAPVAAAATDGPFGRDGPETVVLLCHFLRNSLLGRAPPTSV